MSTETHVEESHGESFMDLLASGPHWLFEITTSVVEALVLYLLARLLWPRMHKAWDRLHGLTHGRSLDEMQAVANEAAADLVSMARRTRPNIQHVTEAPVGECDECGMIDGHLRVCTAGVVRQRIGANPFQVAVVLDTEAPAKSTCQDLDLGLEWGTYLVAYSDTRTRRVTIVQYQVVEVVAGRPVFRHDTLQRVPKGYLDMGVQAARRMALSNR